LVNDLGAEVSTVEHVMAALAGCGVHNALIEVDGPEFPILDGSAVPFVRAILGAGVISLDVPVRAIRILAPVEFKTDQGWARFEPSDAPEMQFAIDFADKAIGKQSKSLNLSNGSFVRELCDSRTFCRNSDVETMRAAGLALGGTMENAVVVDGDQILSPGGLRHADEAVRHKMLDALGDMALAGAPIIGRYVGHRAGHALTNSLLRAMFANPKCFEVVTCDHDTAALLPGAGAHLDEVCAVA
jgi:UDP-3-O-[3-hydroxymyristoyl] N-acetylglucosamine deacetylase